MKTDTRVTAVSMFVAWLVSFLSGTAVLWAGAPSWLAFLVAVVVGLIAGVTVAEMTRD